MCRLWATELSEIKPQLDAHSVGLIGVGMEKVGVDAFVEGGFFKGGDYCLFHYFLSKTHSGLWEQDLYLRGGGGGGVGG